MIKFIMALVIVTVLAVGGYVIYRGLAGDNDNAEKVAGQGERARLCMDTEIDTREAE